MPGRAGIAAPGIPPGVCRAPLVQGSEAPSLCSKCGVQGKGVGQRALSVPMPGTASTGGQEWSGHTQQELLSGAHPCCCCTGQGVLRCPQHILLSHSCNAIVEVLNLLISRAAHRLLQRYLLLLFLCVKSSGCRREALSPGCAVPHGCSVPYGCNVPHGCAVPNSCSMLCGCCMPHGCGVSRGCRAAEFPFAIG